MRGLGTFPILSLSFLICKMQQSAAFRIRRENACGTPAGVWLLAVAHDVLTKDHCHLFRRCFCTAGSWSVECWTSVPAAPRDATGECVARQGPMRTGLVWRARRWRAAPSTSTGRTRPGYRLACLELLPMLCRTSENLLEGLPSYNHVLWG
jgi:hypothetical protein